MTEKRYCIICGKEIRSDNPEEVFCPEHGGQASPPQDQQAARYKPQVIDHGGSEWKTGDVIP